MTEAGRPTPSEVAQPLEEGRVREENVDSLQSQFDGLRVLADHGADPDITRRSTMELRQISNEFAPGAILIRNLKKPQKIRRDKIEEFGKRLPGLRGMRDTISGYEVQINPHREDEFDEDLLRQSLGDTVSEIVQRTAVISVEIDRDKKDAQAVLKSMRRVLRRKGYSIEEIDAILKVEHSLKVDDEKLLKGIEEGQITLLEGAWERPIAGYNIVARDIKTSDELEEEVAEVGETTRAS